MKATIANHNELTSTGAAPFESQGSMTLVEPTLIKKKELARRLSVSARTIDNWVSRRIIPHIQIGPKFYLYDFEAVLAAIRRHYEIPAKSR